jgi:PAS domain S-box-containing protein
MPPPELQPRDPPDAHATRSIRRKLIASFGVALAMTVAIGWVAHRVTAAYFASADSSVRSQQVLEGLERTLRHLTEVESGARGYAASGATPYLAQYQHSSERAIQSFNALRKLVADDPVQTKRLEILKPFIASKMAFLKDGVEIRQGNDPGAVTEHFGKTDDLATMEKIRTLTDDFASEEARQLRARSEATRNLARSASIAIVCGVVLASILLAVAGVLILLDVEARLRAERKLADERNLLGSVLDAIPDPVFVKNRQGEYVVSNRAHRDLLRANSPEIPDTPTARDLFPPELAEEIGREDGYVLSTGIPILNRERVFSDPSQRPHWYSISKVPLRDAGGTVTGVVAVAADVTERKEGEMQMRLAADQLARSNRELQDFASVVSHDLQEPLRKILTFGGRLRAKCAETLGPDGLDYLDRMSNAATRMQSLIQDLLTLARVTSRPQAFAKVDLRKTVAEVLADLEVMIENSHAKIGVGNLPTIDADPLQMRQLFQNLIGNALKFAKPGEPPTILIDAEVGQLVGEALPGAAPGAEICRITVRDQGIGFDPKHAERVFQVFQRLHSREAYEGTGIGLALVRKIADRHGGAALARSREGDGATFIVTLPLEQPSSGFSDETR